MQETNGNQSGQQPARMPSRHHHGAPRQKPEIKNMRQTLQRIWQYMYAKKLLFFLTLFMVVASSTLSLLGPYLLGVTVDHMIADFQTSELTFMLILLGVIFITQSVAVWLQNYWMITIAQETVQTMRNELFYHIQLLPLPFFQRRQSGEVMSRLTNDMENVSRTLNSSVIQLATSVLTLAGTVSIMLWLSPLLTLLTLTIVPLMFWGMKWITNRTGRYFKAQQKDLGDVNGYVEETLSGHHIIKAFSQEERVTAAFHEKNERLRDSGYWAQTYSGFIPKLMNSLNNLSFTIIVGFGAILAVNGLISIGIIVTFTTYARQFTRPLNDLANQYNVVLSAVAGAERVFEIMDEEPEKDDPQAIRVERLHGEVEFQSVDFAYQEGGRTLSNIDFRVDSGQTVALVGPTGAGKTTLVSLLAQFYQPERGRILLDGQDASKIRRSSLRSNMGIVLQDSYLFETTVRENIRYGKLAATDEEVVQAAKAANADDFIQKLPNGYDTILHADGSGISHGQRQLLSIARVMVADPALLILDEATSSIDTITEMKINDAFRQLMKGKTSFVIAHRLNTVKSADMIVVIQSGKITEKGTHQELLKQNGYYASLVQSSSLRANG
ncbi:ABC transporter ATP-binding protein [Sediminibacillus halophilus]|uniref:ATP-binding cassette, subfamily B n=1 Tax=Sediminibacillus halophilus TaxID=482461 RepID=A0A1G9TKJ4_9BACI|nr:ATP-binding cassette, subfamily B [Sediminibacillus halophilus]